MSDVNNTPPITFCFQASDLVFYPCHEKTEQVRKVIHTAFPVDYTLVCASPSNNHQLNSTFDHCVARNLAEVHCPAYEVPIVNKSSKKHDFACEIASKRVDFEIEKANPEKILYDLLKSHIYLASGADLAVLMLPTKWSHKSGEVDLFDIGKARYQQAIKYGMGTPELFDRIVLVGFNQYYDGKLCVSSTRENMRQQCRDHFKICTS